MFPINYECEGQLSVFDYFEAPFKIRKPIRLIELFAGVGSQAMALKAIGANFEHWKVVEFDKYAIASYNAIHGTEFPTIDVTQIHGKDLEIVDVENYTYLLTYSFPCTDLSVAGKMLGMEEGSGTRSSLLWEVKRLIEECENLPQVLMMENVPQVHGAKNMASFQAWLKFLESKGYSSFWQDMNAKNYGVAQSRNRTIVISFLGGGSFKFPQPYELTKRMKDYLEDNVDKRYYLTSEKAKVFIDKLVKESRLSKCHMINTQSSEVIGQMDNTIDHTFESANRVYDVNALAPTLPTCCGGGLQPKIIECVAMRGRGEDNEQQLEVRGGGITNTITTVQKDNMILEQSIVDDLYAKEWVWEVDGQKYLIRIRKLTPREFWRLMDFSDEDFEKAQAVNSNTQLYKQAGNSIVKNVLCEVFKELIE